MGTGFFAEIPRLKFLESITFHDVGSTRPEIIVWGERNSAAVLLTPYFKPLRRNREMQNEKPG
ncbi:MAG: hypothetical protein FWC84_06670, partial [Alphaproteobacteria bacterium]|nr:hypothetical protein [Alphaproteobacteria bacterium]